MVSIMPYSVIYTHCSSNSNDGRNSNYFHWQTGDDKFRQPNQLLWEDANKELVPQKIKRTNTAVNDLTLPSVTEFTSNDGIDKPGLTIPLKLKLYKTDVCSTQATAYYNKSKTPISRSLTRYAWVSFT